MREARMIQEGSPCDTSFYPDGPMTVEEAKKVGKILCPRVDQCKKDHLDGRSIQCVMKLGREVVRATLEEGTSIQEEMVTFRHDMDQIPTKEFVWSPDGKELQILTDREVAFAKVEEFAQMVIAE